MNANRIPACAPCLEDRGLRRIARRLHRRTLCAMTTWSARAAPAAKRALDIAVSSTALVALSPVMAMAALAIKCGDNGDVFFWQRRVGRHGRVFMFPKFRSMVSDAERARRAIEDRNQHADGVTFKMRHDPRVTPVGRLLRRFSIDELPQLWCVLKGDMSLVGPRPALVSEVARYSLADRRRLDGAPGLTCYWQVQGRADIGFRDQVTLDVRYLEQHHIWLDVRLLAQTVPAVLSGRGAY